MNGRHLGGRSARAILGPLLAGAAVVASVVASIAASVAVATGAAAGTDPPPNPWPDTVSCATGAFTGHVLLEPENNWPYLELSGWVQPCPGEKDGQPGVAKFGFAYMRAGYGPQQGPAVEGVMHKRRLRTFQSADAPTSWSGRFDLWGTGTWRTEAPLCMMRDPATKLACVTVTMVGPVDDPTFTVSPLPLDDPLVAHIRIVFVGGTSTTPECAACV